MKQLYKFINIENTPANVALLLLRVCAGFTIMNAGLDKLPLADWMVDQVAGLGFPSPTLFAWIASFSEFAFGFLLCIGLMTRLSGIMLAITIGVAAFGFHELLPLVEMHITQYFFWIFMLFSIIGGGKFSLDYLISNKIEKKKVIFNYVGVVVFIVLLAFGLFKEYSPSEINQEIVNENIINSINIPGSFNDWDPASNEMIKLDDENYEIEIDFEKEQLVEFKFTQNKSWDNNLGIVEQEKIGFPISGTAQLDKGNETQNIKSYIPPKGNSL